MSLNAHQIEQLARQIILETTEEIEIVLAQLRYETNAAKIKELLEKLEVFIEVLQLISADIHSDAWRVFSRQNREQ